MKKSPLHQVALELMHDIKSPLAKIQAISMILSSGERKTNGKELAGYLQRMEESSKRLDYSLNILLDYIALSPSRPQLSYEFFRIHDLLSEIVGEFDPYEIEINGEREKNFEIMGDKYLLKKTFTVLLKNAVDEKTTQKPLTISLKTTKKECVIFWEDQKKAEEAKGVAYGEKMLAERILELHKGRIFQKKEGKNPYFYIFLPKKG